MSIALDNRMEGRPPPEINNSFSNDLKSTLHECLVGDPDQRPSDYFNLRLRRSLGLPCIPLMTSPKSIYIRSYSYFGEIERGIQRTADCGSLTNKIPKKKKNMAPLSGDHRLVSIYSSFNLRTQSSKPALKLALIAQLGFHVIKIIMSVAKT